MQKENRSRSGLVLGGLMIAIAAMLVGGYGGSQLAASYMLNQGLNKDGRAVQKQVKVLESLRAGDLIAATELLESQLDDNLILFDPQEPYEGLSEQTQVSLDKAIRSASAYRQQNPRKSKRNFVDEAVSKLFDKM
jgi:hypothetical protein